MTNNTTGPRGMAIAITVLLLGAGSTGLFAQADDITGFLQAFPRDPERRDLQKNISFVTEAGSERAGVRCATRPVGQFERTLIDATVDELVVNQGRSHRYGEVNIPVVLHMARTSDRTGHLKKKQIKKQIRVLNRAYAKHGFQFELQKIRRYSDVEFAEGCLDVEVEHDFKSRYAVDPVHTLNVYTCIPGDGVLGYSYHPWDFTETSFMHGVVLLYSTLPKGSAAPYNRGDTLVHEVGHYLGLLHTFEGACADGDQVADTPAEQSPAYGCPLERDTCSAPGMDPVRNFMNYSDDSCMNRFSAGQASQMHDAVATFRSSL